MHRWVLVCGVGSAEAEGQERACDPDRNRGGNRAGCLDRVDTPAPEILEMQ